MRIFQAAPFCVGELIQLDEPASHHLARVLRVEVNDEVTVFNGEGGEYHGVITQISKKNVTLMINVFDPRNPESPLKLCLAQGVSRGDKMDFTIQKAVELGVQKIIPLFTERSTVKLDSERKEKRWEHWQAIMIHAAEQCGRTRIPELVKPIEFNDWLQQKDAAEIAFVLTPWTETTLQKNLIQPLQSVSVLIGPEGGLAEGEIHSACQNGFIPLSLGPRVLRTETASVAALSVLQYFFGDMGG